MAPRATRSSTNAASTATAAASASSRKGKGAVSSRKPTSSANCKKPGRVTTPEPLASDDPAHDPALFQKFVASLKQQGKGSSKAASRANNKRAREEEQQAIQKKTAQLLNEEHSDGSNEDDPPVSKKARGDTLLSGDEQDLADQFSDRHHPNPNIEFDEEEEETPADDGPGLHHKEVNEDEEEEEEEDDYREHNRAHASALQPEEDEDWGGSIYNNGMSVSQPTSKPVSRNSRRSHSIKASSSAVSSTSKSRDVSSARDVEPSASASGKVKRAEFSDNITLLADTAKNLIRTRISFGDWVLESDPSRQNWIWEIINECPKMLGASASKSAAQGLLIVSSPTEQVLRTKLITYVGYGKGALFNTIISKARSRVVGHYGLTGSHESIVAKVEWLLESSHFIYGDLNFREKKFNTSKPFGNPIIKELIQAIWFNTAKAKADLGTTRRMTKEALIPISTVLLVVAAIEHGIGEYKTGAESQAPFKEQQIRNRYRYHYKTWNGLKGRSQTWAEAYPSLFFKAIAKSCNLGNILDDDDDENENTADIQDVNGENLDRVINEGLSLF